ncbi:mercuric resistance operon regulatory protein [Geminocystis sp. NIES-3708]|uniref:heavy metal-responsive transcriptional regulator n=1 Tax=Geminocystis sp. NIES-3708 TaxID=1615909 RepID=UPI0005FC5522|nr:heavy metal-responsive transcriptional regulator [Geminocystis sp. NIES-3708]BAQ62381.1 mercuric resistance operon regulatory protein [Geminocystis sp. NIES-3708]
MSNLLKIGEIAKQTRVSVATLRYYESLKLVQPIQRGENGYRYYELDAVKVVQFIKKAQSLRFSLEEIRQIIEIRNYGKPPCELVKNLLDKKIEELKTQIQQMTSFKAELENYRESWRINDLNIDNQETKEICPLIAKLKVI